MLTQHRGLLRYGVISLVALLLLVPLAACQGAVGPAGAPGPTGSPGPAGTSSGSIAGKVTNRLTGATLTGVTITADPSVPGVSITTGGDGTYKASLPVGVYTLTFKRSNFETATQTVSVVAGQTLTRDAAIKPISPVVVDAGKAQTASAGASVTLKATPEVLDGSIIAGYEWSQISGPKASIDNSKSDTARITLASPADYKGKLIESLELLDRFMVQPINPHALAAAETATFRVTVTTSSGGYQGTVTVTTTLPYEISSSINNVPKGVPVLLNGKGQGGYDWAISAPADSKAALQDASTRNPSFTPDVIGKYTLTEKKSGATVEVYSGTWAGAITGQDSKGQPLAAACTVCHNGTTAADQFTTWKASGHAEIFTQNLNTSTHYGEDCFSCHTVGFDKSASNGGFDDAADYSAFLNSGMLNKPNPKNWTTMLNKYPTSAQLANIQCENCHGPNNTTLHANKQPDAARITLASDACGTCHGEPLRHGRFQQWEESKHADYELAIEEATVENRGATAGSCGRCHSGQGFLAWIDQADLTKNIQGAKGNATVDELKALGLTTDMVQPQTCAVCHDPHAQGTVSGEPNTATVRIQGDTKMLPAGFQAKDVGLGAICITCHNTRNGLHNDAAAPTSYSAPHVAAQGDVLMGENAYLVSTAQRSSHAAITDTCANCHMEKTPPPPLLSYDQSGTNHSFAASTAICANCHSSAFDGKAFQLGYEDKLQTLGQKMSDYLSSKIPNQVILKDYTTHTYGDRSYDVKSENAVVDKINIASIEPTEIHGQQAFLFKFNNPVVFTYPAGDAPHSIALSQAQVQLGDITTDGRTGMIPLNDILVKVGWNYFLVHGDKSNGVHNPRFTMDVLDASIKALGK